jgi:hypothetical protein
MERYKLNVYNMYKLHMTIHLFWIAESLQASLHFYKYIEFLEKKHSYAQLYDTHNLSFY